MSPSKVLHAVAIMLATLTPARAEGTIRLFAAGSLRIAMTEVVRAFEAKSAGAVKVEAEFGASGLLRERIEQGEAAHVFASADTGHPATLAAAGRTIDGVEVFARNALCVIARGGLDLDSARLVDVMLDPATRIGMSTPMADPAGDYALKFFERVERARPGDGAMLDAKALRLTGGPASPKAPDGRSLYAWVIGSGQADLFLTYCTNTLAAKRDSPALTVIDLPKEYAVGVDYGMALLAGAPAEAGALSAFILGEDGQAILARHGFLPRDGGG